jgi:hypothetical protein
LSIFLSLNCAEKGICNVGVLPSCILTGKPNLDWYEHDDNALFGWQVWKISGGQGLFDDLEDTSGSLWNTKDKLTVNKSTCQ